MWERQREQQRAESRTTETPTDLRAKIIALKRARDQAKTKPSNKDPNTSPTQQPEARRVKLSKELISQDKMRQLSPTTEDALRLQREIPATTKKSDSEFRKIEKALSKGNLSTVKTLDKASIVVHYLRPVTKPMLLPDRFPPWFEQLRKELQRVKSPYVSSLRTHVKLAKQQASMYDERLFQTRDFMMDPATPFPMGKEVLQKTRIGLFEDSTLKARSHLNNTLWNVVVMNMPCSLPKNLIEVTNKVFGPAATETISPVPPLLIFCNVISHFALRGTQRYLEPGPE